jgi:hypothetical protein
VLPERISKTAIGILGTKAAFNPHSCRVRRKRQRLPSSLLIENASADAHFFASAVVRRGISDEG